MLVTVSIVISKWQYRSALSLSNDEHINCVVLYVEDIGIDVMGELHNQRAALIRTKDRVSKQ